MPPERQDRRPFFLPNHPLEHALDLLFSDTEIEVLEEKLTALFLINPTVVREQCNPPRKKTSARRLLNFHKRQKKHCF